MSRSGYLVKGRSMYPFLKMLDECFSEEAEPGDIRRGDMIIYTSPGKKCRVVHRVIKIFRPGRSFLVKGDNVSRKLCERVAFSGILGKVVKVRRSGNEISLESVFYRCLGKIIALLSTHDLTPALLKVRFLESLPVNISKSALYLFFRRAAYAKILYLRIKNGNIYRVLAVVNNKKSGEAVLELKEGRRVFAHVHIRRRDRNSIFADKFTRKILESARKEFGSAFDTIETDKALKGLISFEPGNLVFI
ncbi:MAG: hypothetical protein ABH883_04795 [Candidatus Omnitrophota bacterium]